MTIAHTTGHGGLPMINVSNGHADALISVYAGQVLSFKPKGTTDVLFASNGAYYQEGKAIKGGIPICWPWFGPDPEGKGRPAHGLARTRMWKVLATAETAEGATQVRLGLESSAETLAIWPYRFGLELAITVGTTLQLALVTRNVGSQAFSITQALHTYFAVGDIAQTQVLGLEGAHYIDKAAGANGAVRQQDGAVTVSAEVDRVYLDVPPALTVVDTAGQRQIRIASSGNKTAVVWNPWAKIAAEMGDLLDDDYLRFICVETANAGDDVVEVAPGGEFRLVVEYAV
ncbi:D-hexose-6-phosphate mutarotase [Candidatus Thiothrix sp. Deng01]|uniref:Putative glucose-6-phosphate 1-epimerase n=1 Tax=Candidatus Thiothrix phosphatis TaxID=3112415 RepID=A0ABU6CT79_9GAMM|nr:D-hexose-6-phosphate mutarotase [Candidatus Thiothrix sp. Deng01]MEB4589613.1 D-hexose-6-phosphate mutarotase [Candidatus Thiothrix sp. Deng01]